MSTNSNKRIHREIDTLRKKGYAYDITMRQDRRNNTDVLSTLLWFRTAKDNLVCIHFDHFSYPFYPPKITINDKNYSSYFACKHPKIIQVMKKLITWNKNFCFCCHTLLCNWSPVNNIEHILREIEFYNMIKRNIIYKLFYDEIDCLIMKNNYSNIACIHGIPRELLKYIFSFLVNVSFTDSFYM